jgi:hypothetical protein
MTCCVSAICLFSIAAKEIRSTFCALSTVLSGSPINIKVYGFASNKTCCSHHISLSPKLLSMPPCNSTTETNSILRWCVMCKEVTMFVILNCSKQVETHWNSGKQSKHLRTLGIMLLSSQYFILSCPISKHEDQNVQNYDFTLWYSGL